MIAAARKRMDIVGTYCLALITAFGGGTVRDLLIDRRPFFWVRHQEYLWIIGLLCAGFVYFRPFHARVSRWHARAVAIDAMGLALFTLSGVGFALGSGMPMLTASLIGVITGTFGGVLRDVVSNEIPVLFQPGRSYAVSSSPAPVSFGGAWLGLPTRSPRGWRSARSWRFDWSRCALACGSDPFFCVSRRSTCRGAIDGILLRRRIGANERTAVTSPPWPRDQETRSAKDARTPAGLPQERRGRAGQPAAPPRPAERAARPARRFSDSRQRRRSLHPPR
jgi:uncharacterized membrane protein YeiH